MEKDIYKEYDRFDGGVVICVDLIISKAGLKRVMEDVSMLFRGKDADIDGFVYSIKNHLIHEFGSEAKMDIRFVKRLIESQQSGKEKYEVSNGT